MTWLVLFGAGEGGSHMNLIGRIKSQSNSLNFEGNMIFRIPRLLYTLYHAAGFPIGIETMNECDKSFWIGFPNNFLLKLFG